MWYQIHLIAAQPAACREWLADLQAQADALQALHTYD